MCALVKYIKITRKRHFSLPQNVQAGSGAHPAFYSIGTRVLCRD